jgi:hypothetical protein
VYSTAATADNPPFGRLPQQAFSAWAAVAPLPLVVVSEKLPPSVLDVPVNDPPFSRRRSPQFHSAWWDVYFTQPIYEASPGAFGAAPQVDNPPFGARPQQSYAAWWTPPPAPSQRSDADMSSGVPGQSIDAPPSARSAMPPPGWWLVAPAPTQRSDGDMSSGIPGQSVDDPPVPGRQPRQWDFLWWQPPYTLPIQRQGSLSPGVPGQSVDDPPRARATTPTAPTPIPFYDLQRRYLVQPFVAAQPGDSAPFSVVWQTILRSWQYDPGAPRLPRLLNPSITAVQVDDPPRLRFFVLPPVPPAPLLVQYPKLVQDGGVVAPPPDQPRAPEQLALRWWTVQAPPPALPRQLAAGIPGQSVDAPVGRPASQQPSPTWYQGQQPIVLPRQLAPGVPGQSVDAPPSVAARQPARAWYDGLYPVAQRTSLTPPAAAVDFAPVEALTSGWSVSHWFAPYVAPQRARPLSSALLAVRVDDPPFDVRRLGRLASIVARAQIPIPDKVYLRYVVQEGPLVTLMNLVCGSLRIGPAVDASMSTTSSTLGSPVAEPAVDGDLDTETCE